MNNYLTYPCKHMRITQNYNGKTSHYPHTVGTLKDYPIDEGGKDTSKSECFYCPCDEMIVKRKYTSGTNTFWLQSTSKVDFADGTSDYVTMLITHCDDSDMASIYEGKTYTRGEYITMEGTEGATGYHFHISAGKGTYTGTGWILNTNKKYVLTCSNDGAKPETLFYIDKDFTSVSSMGSIAFKYLPVAEKVKPKPIKIYITSKMAGKKIMVKVSDHSSKLECEVSDSGNAITTSTTYKYAFDKVYELDGNYYTDETKTEGRDFYRSARMSELKNKTGKLWLDTHNTVLATESDQNGEFVTTSTTYMYLAKTVYKRSDGTFKTWETKSECARNYIEANLADLKGTEALIKVSDHDKILTGYVDADGYIIYNGTYDYKFKKAWLKRDGTWTTSETKSEGRKNY